jgi:hypothetical protein
MKLESSLWVLTIERLKHEVFLWFVLRAIRRSDFESKALIVGRITGQYASQCSKILNSPARAGLRPA